MITGILAGSCGDAAQCAKYATSTWSPGGLILLGIIVVIVIAFFKRKS